MDTKTKTRRKYSPEEYLALDDAAPEGVRLEYINGEIYLGGHVFDPSGGWDAAEAFAGASPEHNQIKHNVETALDPQLRDRDCAIFSSDQRVKYDTASGYAYPDIVVSCAPEYDGAILKNPQLLIEILSESTMEHDLTTKMAAYASMETMREYWFISINRVHLIQCFRSEIGWGYKHYSSLDLSVRSEQFDLEIPLREVFRRVFS
jgi:Uma2 family endonuclease